MVSENNFYVFPIINEREIMTSRCVVCLVPRGMVAGFIKVNTKHCKTQIYKSSRPHGSTAENLNVFFLF